MLSDFSALEASNTKNVSTLTN